MLDTFINEELLLAYSQNFTKIDYPFSYSRSKIFNQGNQRIGGLISAKKLYKDSLKECFYNKLK